MSACKFCGPQFEVTGKFCPNCGKSQEENFDDRQNLQQFAEIIQDSFFEIEDWQSQDGFLKSTQRIREKLLISHATSVEQFNNLKKYLDEKQPLSEFQLEFNQNVIDAFAGHDTYLQFRFTNKSASGDNYKVYIFWDDRETEDEDDLHIRSNTLIKPNQSIELGGTHIFMRAGPKEISELTITVSNQFKDEAKFKVTPFNFRVKSPTQNVINQITTKNEISIEGRGVVDAANMGGQQPITDEDNDPKWVPLEHFLINSLDNETIPNRISSEETITATKESSFDESEIINEIKAEGDLSPKKISGEFKETPSGNLWSGNFDENGHAHGHGTLQIVKDEGEWQHDDAEFYEGNIYHSEITDLSGKAEIKYRSGDKYIGTVYDLKPHGMGTKTFGVTEGKAYKGMYCLGDRHGLQECYEIEERYSSDGTLEGFNIGEFVQGECFADDVPQGTGYITNDDWFRITNSEWDQGNNWVGYWSHPEEDGTSALYAGFEDNHGEADLVCDQDSPFYGLVIYGYDNDAGSVQGIYHGHIENRFRQGQGTYLANNLYKTDGEWYEGLKHGLHNTRTAGEINFQETLYDNDKIDANDNNSKPETLINSTNNNFKIFEYPVDPVSATIWNHCYFGAIHEVDSHFWDHEWWNFLGHDLNLVDEIKSGGNGRKVITDKKRNNVYEVINPHKETGEFIVLVFDSTLFGSCKDFSLFTNKSFWTKDINMPLVRYNYSFIKKAEPTGKKLNQLKLYLSDNTTYITKFSAGKADVVRMHADLLNSLSTL
jgi:uncharacterized Zn finger protein (UPF0148 family)